MPGRYDDSVFINAPFDDDYKPLFEAIVFAVADCGFSPRCALEFADSGEVRIAKIYRLIRECRFGIHDLSRIQLSGPLNLPRFNMPLETGIFLGARQFGSRQQRQKQCLILDSEHHRYRHSTSDLAGQDIESHGDNPDQAIRKVRNWQRTASGRDNIPGAPQIIERHKRFLLDKAAICERQRLSEAELIYADFVTVVGIWLEEMSLQ